jgi:hypothetical protein
LLENSSSVRFDLLIGIGKDGVIMTRVDGGMSVDQDALAYEDDGLSYAAVIVRFGEVTNEEPDYSLSDKFHIIANEWERPDSMYV